MKSNYGENDNESNVKTLNVYLNIKNDHYGEQCGDSLKNWK